MIVSIKGREADQHRINIDTVIKLFSNFSRCVKEISRTHDIADLELQIVDIKKQSFDFQIEPVFSAPLFSEERKEAFLEETEKIFTDFQNENEENLGKYSPKIRSYCAAIYSDISKLNKMDYTISIEIKKRLQITPKTENFLQKYLKIYEEKGEKKFYGIVSGQVILKNNRVTKVNDVEYYMNEKENQIVFNSINIGDRILRFKNPISTLIKKNEDGTIEIPLPETNQSSFGMSEEEAIHNFRELIEVLHDEYCKVPDDELHSQALQLKLKLKKIISEE